jgi:hypothetical protein
MFVFSENSTRRAPSVWGVEVKKRLIEKNIRQDEIVKALKERGFNIAKAHFTNLLYGIGASTRAGEIKAINEMLDIPFEA